MKDGFHSCNIGRKEVSSFAFPGVMNTFCDGLKLFIAQLQFRIRKQHIRFILNRDQMNMLEYKT